ncbi:MAG: ATP-binding protein [Coriobacteriia bacterium]|nr:ATP-binding protein [Coriobacteriia bacterium]
MNAPLLNEASLMAVVAGEFVCVGLQVVHLFLVLFRGRRASGLLACALELAALLHLALALILTVGAGLIGAPVLAWALEASRAFWLLWVNALFAALAVVYAVRLRAPAALADALFMGLCAPAVIRALGPAWNVAAVLDIAWFLFRGLSGIVDDLVRRSEELSGLSLAEALMGIPAGILVVGATGGSAFMNVRMRECLQALGFPCDLGDQSGLWRRLSALGRDLSAEASSLGVPEALAAGQQRLLVDLPDATTWLFARDVGGAQGRGARIVCLDVTEAVRTNAALSRTNREIEEAAEELRATLADVGCAAEAAAYLRMRSRVHDVVGQRLSILHRYLETGRTDAASVAELDRLLSSVMADLRGGGRDASAELEAVVAAFALVGVDVEVAGELPAGEAGSVLAHIVREACTNACRHGHARRVFVDMGPRRGGRVFVLTVFDDGEAGEGPIIERGGIAGMRRRVGALGGTLSAERGARFTLRAEIPMEGGAR